MPVAVRRRSLGALPTSGDPWNAVFAAARQVPSVNLADQDSTAAAHTLAAALVFCRTRDRVYRRQVKDILETFASASLDGARVLSLGRQLAGFATAANLIGYHEDAFWDRMSDLRTLDVGGHSRWYTIAGTSEDSCNNWGGWALASRAAISAYLEDDDDLDRCHQVFSGYFDRAVYSGFARTSDYDSGWTVDPSAFVPINPPGDPEKSGACVEDISRSGGNFPNIDETGIMYSWEFIGGASLTARVLSMNGYPEVYSYGQNGLERAGRFLNEHGGWPPPYSVNQYIPWDLYAQYGQIGEMNRAGFGRQFGFTDWLVS